MEIIISIIVPAYNCENYLEDLLKDIQKQSFIQYEVILIDDGSEDGSGRICDDFCREDSRFQVFHIENDGVSHARNVALSKAKGKYIRFLDSDDRVNPDSLEILMKGAESSGAELVIGRFHSEREVWQPELEGVHSKKGLFFDFSQYVFSFYYGVVWNKLYLRECIVRHGIMFDEEISLCEDALFNFSYFQHVHKVYYIRDEIYCYHTRTNSLVTNVTSRENEIVETKCINVIYRFIHDTELDSDIVKDNMMKYLAYRYHTAYCRICYPEKKGFRRNVKEEYKEYKKYLSQMNCRKFWGEFKNPDQFFVYKVIKVFTHIHWEAFIFVFVRAKEYVKVHSQRSITVLRKIIKNPTMRV